ncbi:hypothetical protein [Thauera sp.]|uniref:hypothetical protein n=1 Tax=Thauera sp. TaxID=1905334 RepID=UPI0039E71C39
MQFTSILKSAFTVLSLAAALHASATERPEVGRYVQAYQGEENVTVYVVRLGPAARAEALLQVTGIDHELDGVIHKARVSNDGSNTRSYRIPATSGRETVEVLRLERDSGRLLLNVSPHGLTDYRISYSRPASLDTSAEHMLTRWLEQDKRR